MLNIHSPQGVKMLKLKLLLVLLIMSAACAAQKVKIVVYTPDGGIMGTTYSQKIKIDGKHVASVKPKHWTEFEVEPGQHELTGKEAKLSMAFEAGKTYYFTLILTGYFSRAHLRQMVEEQGKLDIASLEKMNADSQPKAELANKAGQP
jgi:hypothetical protein